MFVSGLLDVLFCVCYEVCVGGCRGDSSFLGTSSFLFESENRIWIVSIVLVNLLSRS